MILLFFNYLILGVRSSVYKFQGTQFNMAHLNGSFVSKAILRRAYRTCMHGLDLQALVYISDISVHSKHPDLVKMLNIFSYWGLHRQYFLCLLYTSFYALLIHFNKISAQVQPHYFFFQLFIFIFINRLSSTRRHTVLPILYCIVNNNYIFIELINQS